MPLARHDLYTDTDSVKYIDFYSHASCEAWRCFYVVPKLTLQISTHMPLARHDQDLDLFTPFGQYFYSHASCEAWPKEFLHLDVHSDFYSHASCEAWHNQPHYIMVILHFYSHASCEAWPWCLRIYATRVLFLLTCLLRGMTAPQTTRRLLLQISTHMPLARHDLTSYMSFIQHTISTHMPLARHDDSLKVYASNGFYFYSHASCEAWLYTFSVDAFPFIFLLTCLLRGMTSYKLIFSAFVKFLLTCLLRGMTNNGAPLNIWLCISTHMPLARHDRCYRFGICKPFNFYSHASCEAWP